MAISTPTKLGTKANAGAATTVVLTITAGVAKGDHVIVGAGCNTAGTTISFSDSRGNTYQVDKTDTTLNRVAVAGSAKITTALQTNDTITATLSASVTDGTLAAYSVNGLDQVSWFDTSASATGVSTAPNSGTTATRAVPNELLFGVCCYLNAGVAYTASGFNTLLDDFNNGTSKRLATEYLIVNVTGTGGATGTITSTNWTQLVVTYKAVPSPNVSDTITTSESIKLLNEENPNVSDTVTTAESIGMFLLSILVSDTITTSESVGQLLLSFINVNDSISITESIGMFLLSISVSDTITTSESLGVLLLSFINTSDPVSLSEAVTLLETSFVNVNDAVTTSESINLLNEENPNVSDSISLTESLGLLLISFINVNDTITTSESVGLLLLSSVGVSDTVTTSESLKMMADEDPSVSDSTTVTISESVTLLETSFVAVSDTITTSESVSVLLDGNINVSDSPILLDQRTNQTLNPGAEGGNVNWTAGGTGSANVSIGSTDFAFEGTKSIKVLTTSNDAYAYQDVSVTSGRKYAFSAYIKVTSISAGSFYVVAKKTDFSTTYGTSTTLTGVGGFTQVTGSFTVPAGVTTVRLILDNASGTTGTAYYDAVLFELNNDNQPYFDGNNGGVWTGAANTSTSVKSLATVQLGSSINVSDNATLSESVSFLIPTLLVTASDTVTTSEVVSLLETSLINTSDGVSIAESVNLLLESGVNVSDAITLSESVSLLETSFVNVSDAVTITEAFQLLEESYVNVSDAASLAESVTVTIVTSPGLQVNVSDSISGPAGTRAPVVIVLTDGRLAVRLGGNLYIPL